MKYVHDLHVDIINLHVVNGSEGSSDEIGLFFVLAILVIVISIITFLRSRNSFGDKFKKSKKSENYPE